MILKNEYENHTQTFYDRKRIYLKFRSLQLKWCVASPPKRAYPFKALKDGNFCFLSLYNKSWLCFPNLNYFHQLTVLTQTLITSTTTCYIILLFTTDNHQHLKATCFFNWMQFNFFKINVNSYHLYILAGGTLKGVNYHHKAKLRINESIRKDLYWMVSLSCLKFLWPWHEIILKRDIP